MPIVIHRTARILLRLATKSLPPSLPSRPSLLLPTAADSPNNSEGYYSGRHSSTNYDHHHHHLRTTMSHTSADPNAQSVPASGAKGDGKQHEHHGQREKLLFAPAGGAADPTSHQAPQYTKGALDAPDLSASPILQFHTWFAQAQSAGVYQPETTCLATASLPDGAVSARIVYLKELDATGFVVYSNWETSRKGRDVASNPRAALTFWWREVERQVRVEGRTERLGPEESQAYFDTRIRGSRLGAWASRQSQPIAGRAELEERVREVERRFEGQEHIPVPPFWGGMRIVPDMVEFWQGRESRLHDRFRYTRDEAAGAQWKRERLSP